jgi:hypothetical protein
VTDVGINVGTAWVDVKPATRGFSGNLSKALSPEMDKAGKVSGQRLGESTRKSFAPSVKGIVAPLVGAFAAVKVSGFLKGAIGEASDLSESMSKVNVVFGKSSPLVRKFAKTAAKSLGQSQQQALEAAGTFGNLFTALKIGQQPAAKMSTSLVKLAGDLASFNNVDPAQALDALRSGLTGETEPLKRFGVNINQATLQAQALKLGLVKSVKDGLTPAVKAQAAYSLILEQTKTAQGDFTRTSGGLANQQRILSAQWTDMKAKVGGGLLPVTVAAVKFFNGRLLPSLGRIGKAFDPIKRAIGELNLTAGFRTAATAAGEFFTDLRARAGHLFDGIKLNVKPIVTSITTQLRNLGQPIVDALQYGLQTGDFSKVGAALGRALAVTVNGAATGLGAVTRAFGNLLGKVDWVTVGVMVGRQLPALLIGLSAGILNLDFAGLLRGLAANWQSVLIGVITVAFAPAKLLGAVGATLGRVPFAGPLLRWGLDGFVTFSKGVKGYIGDFLAFLGREFLVGMRRAGLTIGQSWGAALEQLPLRLVVMAGRIGGEVLSLLRKVGGFFRTGASIVARAAGDVAYTVLKAFRDMTADLFKAGASLIGALARGMLSRLKDVGAAVGKIAGKIRGFFPGSPVKEGPLTSWNGGGAGSRLVQLLATGLGSTAPVEVAVERLASVINMPTRQLSGVQAFDVAPFAAAAPSIHYEVHNPLPEPASVSHATMLRRLSYLHATA